MKKLVLTTVCAMALSGAAFAQGFINLSFGSASITFETNSTQYSPLGTFGGQSTGGGAIGLTAASDPGAFDYALLYSAQPVPGVANSDLNVWDGTWFSTGYTGTNNASANAGRVNTVQASGNETVPWANGVTNNIILVGWSVNLGTSWTTVSNELANWSTLGSGIVGPAYFGETSVGYIDPSLSTPGAAIIGNGTGTANGLPIFSLNSQLYLLPVPEPTTLALAGLGGLSLMLFRRQRK